MSYNRTVRPSVSRVNASNRGPGVNRSTNTSNISPTTRQRTMQPSRSMDSGMSRAAGPSHVHRQDDKLSPGINTNVQAERRMEHMGAYSMMTPNEKKRSQIRQQAQKETQEYEAYKQANKLTYVSYTGAVGGGPVQQSRLVTQQPGRYERMEQRNRYRREAKEREEEEYRLKKEKARNQSLRNEQRSTNDDSRRQAQFRDDHRRRNEAFLDRLEGKR